jgi:hypothetical protein
MSIQIERVKTEDVNAWEMMTMKGMKQISTWRETGLLTMTSSFAEVVAPADKFLVITARRINPSLGLSKYRAYPEGTYAIDSDKTDGAENFIKSINARSDRPSQSIARRVNILTPPAVSDAFVYEDEFVSTIKGSISMGQPYSESSPFIVAPGHKFLLEFANENTLSISFSVRYEYFILSDTPG